MSEPRPSVDDKDIEFSFRALFRPRGSRDVPRVRDFIWLVFLSANLVGFMLDLTGVVKGAWPTANTLVLGFLAYHWSLTSRDVIENKAHALVNSYHLNANKNFDTHALVILDHDKAIQEIQTYLAFLQGKPTSPPKKVYETSERDALITSAKQELEGMIVRLEELTRDHGELQFPYGLIALVGTICLAFSAHLPMPWSLQGH